MVRTRNWPRRQYNFWLNKTDCLLGHLADNHHSRLHLGADKNVLVLTSGYFENVYQQRQKTVHRDQYALHLQIVNALSLSSQTNQIFHPENQSQ